MTNLVLINPPLSYDQRLGPFKRMGSHSPPFNLCYLAAAVRPRFSVAIIDAEAQELSLGATLTKLKTLAPKVVGITCTTIGFPAASHLAKTIRQRYPELPILFGGVHFSSLPEQSMREAPDVDIGFIGEAEQNLPQVLERLEAQGWQRSGLAAANLSELNGLIIAQPGANTNNERELRRTRPPAELADPNLMPPPAFDLLPELVKTYRPSTVKYLRLPSAVLITARGCPYKCNFCDHGVLKNRYRPLDLTRVESQIDLLISKWGIRDFNVHDDTLTISPERTIAFCQIMRERKLSWSCQSRVDTITPELLKLMQASGCWSIAYGVESGSQRILDRIEKGTTIAQIESAVQATADLGIDVVGFFLMGSPGENTETLQASQELALRLPFTYILPWYYTPFPGSSVWPKRFELGQLTTNDWAQMGCWHPVFIPHGLSKEELQLAARTMVRKFYLRPSYMLRYLKTATGRPYFWRKTRDGLLTLLAFGN